MGKETRHLYLIKSVFSILLCFTAYACTATHPTALRQADISPSENQLSANSSSEKDISSPQYPAPTGIAKSSEAVNPNSVSCDPKKNDELKQDQNFEVKIREIIAYVQKKNSKKAVKVQTSEKTSSVRNSKADEDTEMVGETASISEDTEYIQETSELAENTSESDNAVGEAEYYIRYSKKMGIKPDGDVDQQLLDEISKWFGSPYRMGGCSKGGVDCSCFVKTIYEDVYGIELKRDSRSMYQRSHRVGKNDLQEGDLIYFKIRGRRISHVGIYLGNNKFVHSSRKHGVVIDSLNHPYYQKRFVSGGRVGENVGFRDGEPSEKKAIGD